MGKKKSSKRSVNAEFKKGLDVLVGMAVEMQKQLDKGECILLSLKEAADFLGCSDSFLYKLTADNLIPFYKPRGRLYFFQHELEKWIKGKEDKSINNQKEGVHK